MPKFFIAVTAISSLLATLVTASVAQTLPSDLPLGIVCYTPKSQTWVVGYLQTVNENGTASYRGVQAATATLNKDRVLEPPSNRAAVLDCFGKSLDQLRAMGRLIPLQPISANK